MYYKRSPSLHVECSMTFVSLVPRPPPFNLPFAFTIIHESGRPVDLPIPCIIVNANGRSQNGGGLGPRLDICGMTVKTLIYKS